VGGYVKCTEFDLDRIKNAHEEIVANNDAFGLVFSERNGSIAQYVTQSRNDVLPIVDLSREHRPSGKAAQWVKQFFEEPMFSYHKTLYASVSLKVSDTEYWYVCKCHHLIMDGVGFANWAFKLSDYYNGKRPRYETVNWSEIVEKDSQYIESKAYQKNKLYWQKQFEAGTPQKIFPKLRDNEESSSGRYNSPIPRELLNKLVEAAQKLSVNVSNLFITAIAVYISRAYEQERITFGLPAHNRKSHLEKGILNVFTNISPLTVEIDFNDCFSSLVSTINKKLKENFRHQRFPTGHLSRLLNTQHEAYPFSGINFNFLHLDYDSLHFSGEAATVVYYPQQQEQLPLTITFFDGGQNGLELQYDFNPAYFNLPDIKMISSRIDHILSQLVCVDLLTCRIHELSILTDTEKQILLNSFVGETRDIGHSLAIHELFTKQANTNPGRIALTCDELQLSYSELNTKTDNLAAYLKSKGRQKGRLIGIYMDRTVEMVLAIIAILKSGAAYVPLEPSLPRNRFKYILSDTGLAHILTTKSLVESIPNEITTNVTIVDYKSWSPFHSFSLKKPSNFTLSDIAYVIYTSGSTGKPKGVEVSHRALMNRVDWMNRQYDMTMNDKVLQKTPFSFDVSVWEFLWPLSAGGQLVIAKPEGHKDPRYLSKLIESHGITKLHFVPSMLSNMLKHGNIEKCTSLKQLFCSGEELSSKHVQDFYSQLPNTELHNLYGPTEAAIDVSYFHCTQQYESLIPIGKAIQNTHLLVLDKRLELMPMGVIGELYISGVGLADGYLNKPELTESAFINNPYFRENEPTSSKKLYKTGDLVRYRADGCLEYIGRNDTQVKIRGQRIELSEIENMILEYPGIDETKVLLLGEKKDSLIAYTITKERGKDTSQKLATFLRESLPVYMVPNRFVQLDEWPLTANGKIDVKQLKSLNTGSKQEHIYSPENDTQRNLRSLWADLLKVEVNQVCINQNFFRIGGNSLQCSEMIHEAEERFQYTLNLTDIFQHSTIASLASFIDSNVSGGTDKFGIVKRALTSSSPLSFVQYQIWLAEQISGPTTKHNMTGGVKLKGKISVDKIRAALENLVLNNVMLNVQIGLRKDGEPFQFIEKPHTLPFVIHNLKPYSKDNKSMKCSKIIAEFCSDIFSLNNSTLFKACVISLSEEEVLIYFSFHHIICDGWTVNITFNKFLELYDDKVIDEKVETTSASYFDYVSWQNEFISTHEAEQQRRFWKDYLSGCNPVIDLPFKKLKESHSVKNLANELLPFSDLSNLKILANTCEASLANVIHCVLAIVLGRITAERDLIIGMPVSGRNLRGTGELFGPFVNILPIRTVIDESLKFAELLRLQTQNMHQVLSHQELPFEHILNQLPFLDRSSKETPLFQVCLNVLSLPKLQLENANFHVELEPIVANENKFNLTFYISEQANGLQIQCSYDNRYGNNDVVNLLSQLRGVFEQISKYGGELLCSRLSLSNSTNPLPWIKKNIGPSSRYNEKGHTVIEMFEHSTLNIPNALALSYQHRQWTYQELNKISSLYSERLVDGGVKKGDIVVVLSGRSDHLVIAILAILKVGAAFLILSNDEPNQRVAEKLSVLKFAFLLNLNKTDIQRSLTDNINYLQHIRFDNLNMEKATKQYSEKYLKGVSCLGDDLAYIAFTSGTEGHPKAIMGAHSSLAAYTPWLINKYGISQKDRFALLSGLTHDPLQREIFTALMANASIHIPNEQEFDFVNISCWLEQYQISVLNITPSLATIILLNDLPLKSLLHVFLCGEPLSIYAAKQILEHNKNIHLVNIYGATESCRALSYYDVYHDELEKYDSNGNVPLGFGVEGVELMVLNEQNYRCGIGEVGQIAIRAEHLTLGYYNDSRLTSEKFLSTSIQASERKDLYLTGDYGRYDSQGVVNFSGRRDRQVKIRGYRVEPVEVETAIKRSNLVDSIVVNASKSTYAEYQLVAYIVANKNERSTEKELMVSFRRFLPAYMVPSKIVIIDSVPFNSNGKINWSKLSELNSKEDSSVFVEPNNEVEEEIRNIWQRILKKSPICVLDNFFNVGGNSILAVRVLTSISKEFSTEIPFSIFFEENTIRKIAEFVEVQMLERAVIGNASKNKNVTSI
jgi:amino acid adenylation domain-containing protein